jgi:hypothetical protein
LVQNFIPGHEDFQIWVQNFIPGYENSHRGTNFTPGCKISCLGRKIQTWVETFFRHAERGFRIASVATLLRRDVKKYLPKLTEIVKILVSPIEIKSCGNISKENHDVVSSDRGQCCDHYFRRFFGQFLAKEMHFLEKPCSEIFWHL